MVPLGLIATTEVYFLPHKFELRDYQKGLFEAFLVQNKRFGFLVWHRRAGKDLCCINLLICKALQRVGNYYYIFPELGQARKAIWQAIDKSGLSFIDRIPSELISKKNDTEMRIKLTNGSSIQLIGASRYDKLVGTAPVGMIFSEYAIQTPQALEFLKPIVNENQGFILLNTTPRGHNHAYKVYKQALESDDWYVDLKTITETRDSDGNPIVSDKDIEDDKIIMTVEKIRQEYFCDWDVALSNSYFSKDLRRAEQDDRVKDFPIDSEVPVHTFWDLGISDSMTICFVQLMSNGEIRFIDYYECNNEGFEHYVRYLHDWRDKYNVVFKKHFAPHDIRQRELSDGQSRLDKARKLGISFTTVDRPKTKIDNIEMSRTQFSKYHFHKTKVRYLLDCLMEYHAKVNPNGTTGQPEHNWASHGVDAFMLVALAKHQGLLNSISGVGQAFMNPACQESLI